MVCQSRSFQTLGSPPFFLTDLSDAEAIHEASEDTGKCFEPG
jgi:hypothetical protein